MSLAMWRQSAALSRTGSTVNIVKNLEHATLHQQGERAHYHKDGSYQHLDHPEGSAITRSRIT